CSSDLHFLVERNDEIIAMRGRAVRVVLVPGKGHMDVVQGHAASSLMGHEHRDCCMGAYMLRDAADEELAQAAVAVTAHNKKVGLRLFRMLKQHFTNGAAARIDKMNIGHHAMKREVVGKRGTGTRIKLLAADTENGDVPCLFEEGQRRNDGARRLGAAIPADA